MSCNRSGRPRCRTRKMINQEQVLKHRTRTLAQTGSSPPWVSLTFDPSAKCHPSGFLTGVG
jgi:hypothetical protein